MTADIRDDGWASVLWFGSGPVVGVCCEAAQSKNLFGSKGLKDGTKQVR